MEAKLLATVLGKSRPFFIEAQFLATVIGQNHDPSL